MERSLSDLTEAAAVELALDEFDQLGRDAFLAKYGFGPARSYFLRRGDQYYDSKAIVGAALGFQFPADGPLNSNHFSGGESTVARKLRELGYAVEHSASESALAGGYARLKALFLLAYPGFNSFRTCGEYVEQERQYKDELRTLFRQLVLPLLAEPGTDAALGKQCLALLRTPLDDSDRKPQNLVGWRYVGDLVTAVESFSDGGVGFGQAVRRLLSDTSDLAARVDRFVASLNDIAGSNHQSLRRRGPQTAITTFYLGLLDPTALMFIKSTQLDDTLDACDPAYKRDSQVFRGADYERLLAVARELYQALTVDHYEPADLVDVQGFLWGALTQAEGPHDDQTLVVRLTAGAINNGYVTLSADAIKFFGDQYCGGAGANELGQSFTLALPNGSSVETDIRRAKPGSAGRLRARFNALFAASALQPGDNVKIRRLSPGHYGLTIGSATMEPPVTDTIIDPEPGLQASSGNEPKNIILYGPPGTGKTYQTAALAVKICTGSVPEDRAALRQVYDQLRKADHIAFVTFHQSFAYEEFVEGLRPVTDGDGDATMRYEVRDGVFKRLCSLAGRASAAGQVAAPSNLRDRRVYKMSLGNRNEPDDAALYEESLRANQIGINWGGSVDYSSCDDADAIRQAYATQSNAQSSSDYAVVAVDYFKNVMRQDDLVLISDGNTRFRAIGEVTGNYQYIKRPRFSHVRAVRWLATFEPSLPIETIFEKRLSQMTIYRPDPSAIKWDALEELLSPKSEHQRNNYVLIIDEINRANISKVLGELITLLEPDKRLGAPEELRAELPYSRERFGVPDNVYVIGTMNTADRSLALLDTALRRRFEFREMRPALNLLQGLSVEDIDIQQMLATLNDRIELLYDREHAIGHAFFLKLRDDPTLSTLASIFDTKILPLLQEYFFEDWERIRLVLGDNQKSDPADQFIRVRGDSQAAQSLFGGENQDGVLPDGKRLYERNAGALLRRSAYQGIYVSRSADGPDEDLGYLGVT